MIMVPASTLFCLFRPKPEGSDDEEADDDVRLVLDDPDALESESESLVELSLVSHIDMLTLK